MTATASAEMTTQIVNPIISSTKEVFEMMLGCSPVRTGLTLKEESFPPYELSAVIGLTGQANGTFVFSVPVSTALEIHNRLLGFEATELNAEVRDAVGEVTNMLAGGAKARLEGLDLSISIPNLVSGMGHQIHYPTGIQPICLSFESEVGDFCMEAGFASNDAR